MNLIKIFSLVLIIFSIYSCRKESNEVLVKPYIPTVVNKCYYSDVMDDNLKTIFKFNKDQSIKEIQKISSSSNEIITYTKINNYIEVKSNLNGYIYKHYINKNGYSDSVWITYIGLVNLKAYHQYNPDGFVIKKTLVGTIANVPFEEITSFTYNKGNLIKKTIEYEEDINEENYEYYSDSINYFLANQEAEYLIPASRNLIKKIILPEDKYIFYTYSKDTNGILYQTSVNESEEVKINTYTFDCK